MNNEEKWIVTSAWPYAHDIPHLGNLIGSLLSADIFKRYLSITGKKVIMVSGSDEHGTPIEVKALKSKVEPKELTDKIHKAIVEILKRFNIEFDNYTRTHTETHINFVEEFYMKIYKNGYIFVKRDKVLYCEKDGIFLPDRFVEGKCPICGYGYAKGDQCENCGTLLDPTDLIDPRCTICYSPPTVKETDHYYFNLPAFEKKLEDFILNSTTLSENAKNFSLSILKAGLKPRSITRNNKWGIPAPFPGAQGLTIYVWFEAVLGYISALKEYLDKRNEKWEDWWFDKNTNVAFFIGKDNIPFHTIVFPALLMATHDPYTLNFYVGATEYLTFEGKKFSKTHKVGIWCDEALQLLPPDYWRFVLTYLRPETKDTSLSWDAIEFIINKRLNDDFGNLIHRTLTLIKNLFNCEIRKHDPSTTPQLELKQLTYEVAEDVYKLYRSTYFQKALIEIFRIVKKANALLNVEKPWETYKINPDLSESTLYSVAKSIIASTIMLYPIIPSSSSEILKTFMIDEPKWNLIYADFEKIRIEGDIRPFFYKVNAQELRKKLEKLRESPTT
ncbi:MAG: methionine--tRNA ligase [Candidatus Geothermarchaeota archaeon]